MIQTYLPLKLFLVVLGAEIATCIFALQAGTLFNSVKPNRGC